eukprot:g20274.t1
MSEEHSSSEGTEEDQLVPAAEPPSGRTVSQGSLEHHREHSEELIPESSDPGNVAQTYPASASISQTSNSGDWNAEKEFSSDEAVTVVNSAQQVSSEESKSTIEE